MERGRRSKESLRGENRSETETLSLKRLHKYVLFKTRADRVGGNCSRGGIFRTDLSQRRKMPFNEKRSVTLGRARRVGDH